MSWTVIFDFQDGSGARDITNLVLLKSLSRKKQLHNNLKPVTDTCSFSITYDSTIINLLLTATKDVLVNIKKNTADYFSGIVRLNFTGNVKTAAVQPFKIECVDYGEYYLKKKIKTVAALSNYKVSDTTNTATSIIHYLLADAGMVSGNILPDDILTTIDYFVISDSDTCWSKLEALLFEMGYVFYFDASGNFKTHDLFPATTTTSNILDSSTNMLGSLGIKKKPEQYEGVSIKWWTHETLTNAIIFNDTTGGNDSNSCNIDVAAGDYYPNGAGDHPIYSTYKVDDRELVVAKNVDLSSGLSLEAGLSVITATDYFTKARLEIHNPQTTSRKITQFKIYGDAVVKGDLNITKVINVTGSTKLKDIKTNYITDSATALRLVSGLGLFYRYSDFAYTCKSTDDFSIGDIVEVKDSISGIDVFCRVVIRRENSVTSEIAYLLEGVSEYAAQTTEDTAEHTQPALPAPGTGTAMGLPTFTDLDTGYTSSSGGTTTPTVPTLQTRSAYKAIILTVDKQTNLRYLKQYEFQVSSDQSNWYSLQFDGTDWKGTLGATTPWTTEQLVHSVIPPDLTDPNNPQPVTLYYRCRRVTVQSVASAYSAAVPGTTSLVETGDIPANTITANMIVSSFLQSAFANISGSLTIGYNGTGTESSPDEGDRRIYIDGDEISFEEYTGGAWSTVNSIKLGGADSNGNFAPFLSCRGVVNPLADDVNVEFFPSEDFRVFNFENHYRDQYGVDDWELKSNVGFINTIKKFGFYSLKSTSGAGVLRAKETWTVGQSQTAGAWVYFQDLGSTPRHTLFGYFTDDYDEIDVFIDNNNKINLRLTVGTEPVITITSTMTVSTGQWYFIGFTYNRSHNNAHLIVNDKIYSHTVSNAWGNGANPIIYAQVENTENGATTCNSLMDELLFAPDINIDPNLFVQHYNHNVPWNTDASAKDLILKPADGGRVITAGKLDTIIYDKTQLLATSFVDIAGLDANTYGGYEIITNFYNPTSGYIQYSLFINGDNVSSHYYYQYLQGDNGSVSAGRSNAPYIGGTPSKSTTTHRIILTIDPAGYPTWTVQQRRGLSTAMKFVNWTGAKTSTVSNITSIRIDGGAGGIGINSRIIVKRIK